MRFYLQYTPRQESLGVNFAVRPVWRSVAFGEGHQLQHVEGVFPASNILLNVLNPTSFSDDEMIKKSGNERKKRKRTKKENMNDGFNYDTELDRNNVK